MSTFRLIICWFFLLASAAGNATEKLVIEPNAGRAPLLAAIHKATHSIDLVMYGLTDESFINTFIQEKDQGIKVNILLEPHPYRAEDENKLAIQHLRADHINLQYPSSNFKLTHQKTIVIDQALAIVMTFNLTHSTFKNERNFALIIDNPSMVKEIEQLFIADWQHKNIKVMHPDLIWSPNNSRAKILDFIQSATSEIKIYAQDISDYQVIGSLAKAARSGKKVQIILSTFHEGKNKKFMYLSKAGVDIRFSKKLLIHAKVIIVDSKRAILGSINLTRPSLNDNRELSVITHEPLTVRQLLAIFQEDWEGLASSSDPTAKKYSQLSHLLVRELRHFSRELVKAYLKS